MPIYEFFCSDCKKTFEQLCSMKADLSAIPCAICGGNKVNKKVSSFAVGGGGNKSFDMSEPPSSGGGSGCGSCSTHSCGTCHH